MTGLRAVKALPSPKMAASRRSLTPSELGPMDENLEIDYNLLQAAFARGLRTGPDYLAKLGRAVKFDSQLEMDSAYVIDALEMLRQMVGADLENGSTTFRLSDIADLLSNEVEDKKDCVFRIGCIAHQLENISPTALNRRESGGTSHSVMSNLSGTGVSSKSDQYEDDFEINDDDEITDDLYGAADVIQRLRLPAEIEVLHEHEELCGDVTRRDLQSLKQRGERYRSAAQRGTSIDETYVENHSEYRKSSSAPSLRRPRAPDRESTRESLVAPPPSYSAEKSPVEREAGRGEQIKRSGSAVLGTRKSKSVVSWIQEKKYQLGIKIGSGSFGEVFQCMNNEVRPTSAEQIIFHLYFQRVSSLGPRVNLTLSSSLSFCLSLSLSVSLSLCLSLPLSFILPPPRASSSPLSSFTLPGSAMPSSHWATRSSSCATASTTTLCDTLAPPWMSPRPS